MFSPVFRHFYDSSEKDVPILCHRGQKFSVLYRFLAFSIYIAVKFPMFNGPFHIRYLFVIIGCVFLAAVDFVLHYYLFPLLVLLCACDRHFFLPAKTLRFLTRSAFA